MEVDEGSDQKIRHLAPMDGRACAFEERVYGGRKVPQSHEMAHFIKALIDILTSKRNASVTFCTPYCNNSRLFLFKEFMIS